jgi:hypothetical protein
MKNDVITLIVTNKYGKEKTYAFSGIFNAFFSHYKLFTLFCHKIVCIFDYPYSTSGGKNGPGFLQGK